MKLSSLEGLLLFIHWHAAAQDVFSDESRPTTSCAAGGESTVLIIGAGMAGLTAAKRFDDLGIDYKLIESTDRVGGRIRSKKFGGYTIEERANWVTPGNKAGELTSQYGLKLTLTDYENFDIYEYGTGGNAIDIKTDYNKARAKWRKAFRCVQRQAEAAYFPGGPDLSLDVMSEVLPACGWDPRRIKESLAYFFPWSEFDYEYGTSRVPLADVVVEDVRNYFVNDERGFDFVPRNFQETNRILVEFGKRVTNIKYNVPDVNYPALVTATTANSCVAYKAAHVLSTLPIGVYESGVVVYDPPLNYTDAPYAQQQYTKIFYKFKNKFWDDEEFIVTLKRRRNKGICIDWQNLDFIKRPGQDPPGPLESSNEFYPGSKILFCTITTEGMKELLGADNVKTKNLSDGQLRGVLLDPLRAVYGRQVVDANLESVFEPRLNTDRDTGFGAFANFLGQKGPSGDVVKNIYNFFGGYDIPGVDIARCEHNGCATINGEEEQRWVLHMGGTASCFEFYEDVNGAIDSGDRSANYIAKELGYDVNTTSGCEEYYVAGEDGQQNLTRYVRRRPPWARHA